MLIKTERFEIELRRRHGVLGAIYLRGALYLRLGRRDWWWEWGG